MRTRWAVIVGVLLGVLGMSSVVAPALATTDATAIAPASAPVTLGSRFITDEVGALSSSDTERLNNRLDELSQSRNIQLFVVFVDTFSNPDNSQQ